MKKFVILALVAVMLMGLLAGCRRNSGNETTAPTTTAAPTTTMAPTTTQAPTTTHATTPDTTSNIITEASEAIDDILPGDQGEGTTGAGQGRMRPMG